jgi:hypothetical protein
MIGLMSHRSAFSVCTVLFTLVPLAASAQPPARSFQELPGRVQIGDLVFVIDESGVETKGKVGMISSGAIALTLDGIRRDFVDGTVRRIEKGRQDSVRNGLLIGIGGGALVGFLAGRTADSRACPRAGIECGQGAVLGTIGGAFWGGVGGWLLDAMHRGREVVYLRRSTNEPAAALATVRSTTGAKCHNM